MVVTSKFRNTSGNTSRTRSASSNVSTASCIRIDVELLHEKNPRQSDHCQRVEITLRGKGPVARAEADAPDFYAALELAAHKLENRLRRGNDRRRVHHGRRTPASVRVTRRPRAPDPGVEALARDARSPTARTSPTSTSTSPDRSSGRRCTRRSR